MKDMFLKKSDIYYSKWATVVQKFQLSMTKLGNHDEIRWFDGIQQPAGSETPELQNVSHPELPYTLAKEM
jgi:hypothetical protein